MSLTLKSLPTLIEKKTSLGSLLDLNKRYIKKGSADTSLELIRGAAVHEVIDFSQYNFVLIQTKVQNGTDALSQDDKTKAYVSFERVVWLVSFIEHQLLSQAQSVPKDIIASTSAWLFKTALTNS